MATDVEMAAAVRNAVTALRQAIATAQAAGLAINPPLMLNNWLTSGNPPGEPEHWDIKRSSL
jgi:hypothetical protein